MGWIKEADDLMSKNKKMRVLIYTLLTLLIIVVGTLSFIVLKSAFQGNKVKVGPIELDKTNNTTNNDTGIVSILPKKTKVTPIYIPASPIPSNKTKVLEAPAIKPHNDSANNSKYNIQNSVFNGPAQVGDGNTQNNNFGINQRHITPLIKYRIIAFLSDNLHEKIHFKVARDDKESMNLSNEIAVWLRNLGHDNLEIGSGSMFFTDSILINKQDNELYIGVSKASNVQ